MLSSCGCPEITFTANLPQGVWWCSHCTAVGRPSSPHPGPACLHEQFLGDEGVGILHVAHVLEDEYGDKKVEGTWYLSVAEVEVS